MGRRSASTRLEFWCQESLAVKHSGQPNGHNYLIRFTTTEQFQCSRPMCWIRFNIKTAEAVFVQRTAVIPHHTAVLQGGGGGASTAHPV